MADVGGTMTVGSLLARAGDPARLAGELGGWVLVGPPPAHEENEWSFRTLSARTVRSTDGEIEAILDDTYLVFPIKKQKTGPWASTVLVGRSRTNDICVAHASISKLHARIRLADGKLWLSDAGSSNGTTLSGDRISADGEHLLTHGSMVRFGGCSFQVFEPLRFAQLLEKFKKTPR